MHHRREICENSEAIFTARLKIENLKTHNQLDTIRFLSIEISRSTDGHKFR